jgi:O-methyltransferase involved in polyketide biosynthesis
LRLKTLESLQNMELQIHVNDISETAFLTLQCHALDAQSSRPLLNDTGAIRTMETLKAGFASSEKRLHRNLFENKVKSGLVTHTVLRAKRYDEYILSFLERYPEAAVVNIGCGLDQRFERVDNGKIRFFDLDLPDIINIKKQIFPEKERYTQISGSVFDIGWIEQISSEKVILVAEGVFMYCREEDVRMLFAKLQEKFTDPEIVFEVFSSRWLRGWRKRIMEFKLKKELKLGEGTTFRFGIPDSDAIETWDPGMRLIDDWSYLDSGELEGFFMKRMSRNERIRKVQWTVHYLLSRDRQTQAQWPESAT